MPKLHSGFGRGSGSATSELGFVIAGTAIQPEDISAVRSARLPLLERLGYRFDRDVTTGSGALIIPAENVLSVERVGALAYAEDREHAADPACYAQEVDLGAVALLLVRLECAILEDGIPEPDALGQLVNEVLPTLMPETGFFDYVVGVDQRIVHDHPVIHRHYVGVLRTALIAAKIGRALRFDASRQAELFCVGLLADLGMIFVPLTVLMEHHLTEPEFEKIRQHPILSFRLLARHGYFSPRVLAGVYGHQRNLDGTGYPADEERPNVYARIVNIASAVAAIIRRGLTVENAIHAIEMSARREAPDGHPLRPKYDSRLTAALAHAWRAEKNLRPQAVIVIPPMNVGMAAYHCVVFDNLTHLLFFLERLADLVTLVSRIEPGIREYIEQGRRADRDLQNLLAMVLQLASYPRAMGISHATDFEEFFSDPSALRDIEKESYAVFMEMQHVRAQIGRVVGRLKHQYVDSAFRTILEQFAQIEIHFQEANALVRRPPPVGA